MEERIAILARLGMSEYESRAYIALLQHGPLNGYELAKRSGIPRANIYSVLQKLEEHGAVVRIEMQGSIHYAPSPAGELIQRMEARFNKTLKEARESLADIASPPEHQYIWNTTGYTSLLAQAETLIAKAEAKLLVACGPQEATALANAIEQAAIRGVTITTLCLAACGNDCAGCRGQIVRSALGQNKRRLILVADGRDLLAGTIAPDTDEETLVTGTHQALMVELATWSIQHSIALALLLDELGDRLAGLVSAEVLQALSIANANGLTRN